MHDDRGLEVLQDWIYALFRPYVQEAYRIVRVQHGLPPTADYPVLMSATPNWTQPPPVGATIQSSPGSSTNTSDEEPSPPLRSYGHQATRHLALLNQRLQQSRLIVEWKYSKESGPGTRTTPGKPHAVLTTRSSHKGQARLRKPRKTQLQGRG